MPEKAPEADIRTLLKINRQNGVKSLASFCRETPEFMLTRVSSPIKLGTTDDRCRILPGVLTRFLLRFHEAPVGWRGGYNDLRQSLPQAKDRRDIVRRVFVCAMSGASLALQSS